MLLIIRMASDSLKGFEVLGYIYFSAKEEISCLMSEVPVSGGSTMRK
jgi:hypothetical protein